MNNPYLYQMNTNQSQFLPLLSIILLAACVNAPSPSPTDQINVHNFPDILNIKGVPDSTTDRAVFAFSDLGAWHGYALPSDEDTKHTGSFVGPFIMTQGNGIWLSDGLSNMNIVDTKTQKTINLQAAEVVANTAFPNRLYQSFQIKNPALLVETQLIFVSNRTAVIELAIQNKSKNETPELAIQWTGNSFLEEVSFAPHPKGVLIDFGKNKNIGWISTPSEGDIDFDIQPEQYKIQTSHKSLQTNTIWKTYLSQSFCFSEKEREKEAVILEEFFATPHSFFTKNENRWNDNITKITQNLHPEFDTEAHRKIAVKCLQTLHNNWRSPAGFLKHDGLFPSYNYEWFNGFWSWDSWKHAVAIARFDPELAQNQIRAMYDFQDEKGMIADCVYRDNSIEEHNWRDTKPPLSAWATWTVFEESKDENFLRELFPKIEKYHNWWYKYRDINQNGLCEYGSTDASLVAAKWESGMDNAVRFDAVKIIPNPLQGGSMNCESIDLNAYLFAEKKYLAKIANALEKPNKAKQYETDAEQLKQAVHKRFYDEKAGWFFDFDLANNAHIKIFGSEGWTPLWTKLATPEQAAQIKKTMTDSTKFATFIPFPTLAADHPKFKPDGGYWRGPVWLDQAYFAIQGLKNYGYETEAIQFSHHLFDRLEGLKNDDLPIRENYHPHTGKGLESNHFSWSAAHLLMLLEGSE